MGGMQKATEVMINNRLGWLLMELPALLVFAFFLRDVTNWLNFMLLIAVSLWGIHYIHRAIIFPFRLKTKGKKMPVVIVLLAIIFNTINGFFNGYWLAHFAPQDKVDLNTDIRLIVGAIVFITGFLINQYHDDILISLRKGKLPDTRFLTADFSNLFPAQIFWVKLLPG